MEGSGTEDPAIPAESRGACRRHVISHAPAVSRQCDVREPNTTECYRSPPRDDSPCRRVCIAEPERAQRQLHIYGDAGRIHLASACRCSDVDNDTPAASIFPLDASFAFSFTFTSMREVTMRRIS